MQSKQVMLTGERINGGEDIEVGRSVNNMHDVNIDEWASSLNNMYDVNIDDWASSLSSILEDVPHYTCTPGHPGRINRIPESIREVDINAYEPYLLSIGPYHHGKSRVQSMEKTKQFVLKCVLEVKPEISLKDYLNQIRSIELAAKSFYSDIDMESEKFVQILLIDSVYILTLLCGITRNHKEIHPIKEVTSDGDDRNNDHMMAEAENSGNNTLLLYSTPLQHDIFLLENQLPFFVLQKIYALIYNDSQEQFASIMKEKIAHLLLGYAKLDIATAISPTTEVHHLLHLCHMFFRPTVQQDSTAYQLPESSQMFRLGSAKQLYEAGVSFIARSDSAQHSLLDITFSRSGEMVIPSLCIDDNTNSFLRNLIALEQMKYPSMGLDVTAYAVLLLHLVTTPEDAQLLRRKGIIHHHLASNKEMMHFVNKLSVGLSFDYLEDTYSLKPLFQDLNRYSEHKVPRWRAWLKHKYFHNPWTTISLLAASVLLILSVVETYYTVYSYYRP